MFHFTTTSAARAALAAAAIALFASHAAWAGRYDQSHSETQSQVASRAGEQSDKGVSAQYASRAGDRTDGSGEQYTSRAAGTGGGLA